MGDVQRIIGHLKRSFPEPEPDATWVKECMAALVDDGQEPTPQAVHEQYLFSDLLTSSYPSLPGNASDLHHILLFPKPTLLQIYSITEIGSSAITLQNTLEQRRDVLSGKTRIRGMDEGEGEEEIVPGKIPEYPRGMLKLEVGDGRGIVKAIEYKRVGDLKLGETALGCKILLQNVKILRGILLLSPENTEIIGGSVDHLESEQPAQFTASLATRLEAAQAQLNAPRPKGRKATIKPAANTKKVSTSTPKSRPTTKSTTAGTTARALHQAIAGPSSFSRTTGDSARETARRARAEAIMQLQTSNQPSSSSTRNGKRPMQSEDEYDIDGTDDSFIREIEAAEAEAVMRSRYFSQPKPNTFNRTMTQGHTEYDGREGHYNTQQHGNDDEDEYDFDDDSFFREIDEAEIIASATQRAKSGSGSGIARNTMASSGASSASKSKPSGRSSKAQPIEVIEISD